MHKEVVRGSCFERTLELNYTASEAQVAFPCIPTISRLTAILDLICPHMTPSISSKCTTEHHKCLSCWMYIFNNLALLFHHSHVVRHEVHSLSRHPSSIHSICLFLRGQSCRPAIRYLVLQRISQDSHNEPGKNTLLCKTMYLGPTLG